MLEGVAPGFAGRGADVNLLLADAPALLHHTERVAANVSDPATGLRRLLVSADRLTGELASVAAEGGSALEGADTTAGALDSAGAALGESIAETPPTQAAALSAFREARPLLTDAAALARDIRPGVRLLPRAADELDRALDEGVPVLRRAVALAARLEDTLTAVAELSEDPATSDALERLLRVLKSAQAHARVLGAGADPVQLPRALDAQHPEHDLRGRRLRHLVPDGRRGRQGERNAVVRPSPRPTCTSTTTRTAGENGECEAGKEPWLPGQQIGNVPGDQGAGSEPTRPPDGVGGG